MDRKKVIDLNCDLGEGQGLTGSEKDATLMKFVSSVNIACGYHAGDAETMERTVRLAKLAGVAIGAHPSYPDLEGFGRRELRMPADEIREIVRIQVSHLMSICTKQGVALAHVKPHGALYNTAAKDRAVASAIVDGVMDVDPALAIVGLSGGELVTVSEERGIRVLNEAFADRSYESDGSLTPRTVAGAVHSDSSTTAAQALRLVTEGIVKTRQGDEIRIAADTICIHGDGPNSIYIASAVKDALEKASVDIEAPTLS